MTRLFDISDFDARPDGTTLNTTALQRAIDACHEAGGGRVRCGPGTVLTGSLRIRSGVELHLEAGCRIVGSPRLEDYTQLAAGGFHGEHAPENSAHALLWAADAEKIAITGAGTVDGAGLAFYDTTGGAGKCAKPGTPRPRIGMFFRCRDLRIQDARFADSACWTLWLMQCEDVHINRIAITSNRRMRNVDGIDLDACRNVTVSDCRIDTEDDCLVLRAIQQLYDAPAVCENVVVANCVLDSGCQGVRVGCPGDGVIRNCTFSNLVIRSAGNGIISEHPHRYLPAGNPGSADITNILFSNVVVECGGAPVKVLVEEGIALPGLGGLSFSEFRVRSGAPCVVQGSSETLITDVAFSGMRIETRGDDALLCRRCKDVRLTDVTVSNRR